MAQFPRDALCRDYDPEDWFPVQEDQVPPEVASICSACPVRGQCLEWALVHPVSGIWAGTTEDQRRKLRQLLVLPR